MSKKQLSKFQQLWQQWHSTHGLATQALSSAVNIHGRLQDLGDPQVFPQLGLQQQHDLQSTPSPQKPSVQELVVCKQLASMDHALSILRDHHEQLQLVVRDLERLYVEVSRGLGSGSALTAASVPQGPEPSLVQVVEAMQDAWVMCRDEMLLKTSMLGLITLDATKQFMAALLKCYGDQPNMQRERIDAILDALQATRPEGAG